MKLILSLACTLCLLFSQSELPSRYHTYDEIVDSLFHWNSLFADNNTPSQYYPGSGIIYKMEEIGQSWVRFCVLGPGPRFLTPNLGNKYEISIAYRIGFKWVPNGTFSMGGPLILH